MAILARVSNIEAFRRWRDFAPKYDGDVEPTIEELIASITTNAPSEAMQAGTAFHKAMELAEVGEHAQLSANGYTFMLPDAEIALSPTRELRAYREYGELTVTGQVDGLDGKIVTDHKTTSRVDLERYMAGAQWKFYLDIFGADVFRWNIFEIKETDPLVYRVAPPQMLTAYRYPELPAYCAELAGDYLEFAKVHLPADFEAAL